MLLAANKLSAQSSSFGRTGSALIESLIVTSAIAMVFCLARAQPFSMGVSRLWIEYQLYQRLRCEIRLGRDCASHLREALHVLPWGRIHRDPVVIVQKKEGSKNRWAITGSVEWCNRKRSPCAKYELLKVEQKLTENDLLALSPLP